MLTLMHGDCREKMKLVKDESVDACVTDPPYGDTSLEWDRRCVGWMNEVARILKPAASVWVFGSMRYLSSIFSEMEIAGFRYAQDIVWEKQNGTGFHADRFRRVHEHAIQFYRGKWADVYHQPQYTNDAVAKIVRRKTTKPTHTRDIKRGDASVYVSEDGGPRLQRSVIFVRNEHSRAVHPTQKPTALIDSLISYSCPIGGTVIDPFMGSGTTGVVCVTTGRKFVGIEKNDEYFGIATRRICDAAGIPDWLRLC